MKFTPVDDMPVRRSQKQISKFIEDFVRKGIAVAKVEYTDKDYASAQSCSGSLRKSASRLNLKVTTAVRGDDVYLINLTMIDSRR